MSDAHFRRSARAAIELRVCFRRDEPGSALEKAGRIADLGMGGAFVQSERPPAIGTPIVLTLQAPTAWDPLELPAEVRWTSDDDAAGAMTRAGAIPAGFGRGFGLKFRALAPTQAAALYELLSSAGFGEREE
ncbi:MAG: PilZ domain-containing protein [Myxococcota bacterium]|nr:PilZ domain-containing protein [Myxococcota bacterium]